MPLNALRSFEAAARFLNFSQAAEELGVTHGAVSRAISILETSLGLRLFVRSQPMRLTDDGQRLLEGVSTAFDRIAATMTSLQQDKNHLVVAVNAPPTFTIKWLIPRLSGFQRKNRNAEVRLTTGTDVNVKSREFDILIRRFQDDGVGVQTKAFLSGKLVPVCAPELLEAKPVNSPGDVTQHRLIEAATNMSNWNEWFQRVGVPKPDASRFVHFEQMFLGLQAAMDGLGIALVPLVLVADDLASGRLVIPLDCPSIPGWEYGYYRGAYELNTELADAFCTWLAEQGAESNELAAKLYPLGSGS